MNIVMDFVTDWQDFLIGDMSAEGLQFSAATSKDSLVIRYFTYLRKKGGEPRPRQVHKSREFVCPPELQTGLDKLVDALQTGQDITPYLSKRVDDISNVDGLFNDWGVLHLHLGEGPDPNDSRFVKRTGPLLFLYLGEDDAYLINVYRHGDWTDKSILQTVQDNWPHLIEPFVVKGALKLSYTFSEEQHAKLRKGGMTVMMQLNDQDGNPLVIVPPGLGLATSGDAIQDVRSYQAQVKQIRQIEENIRGHQQALLEALGGSVADLLQLKLIHENGKWLVFEPSTGAKLDPSLS